VSTLSKPIAEMTYEECGQAAKAVDLSISTARVNGEGWNGVYWFYGKEYRTGLLETRLNAMRVALHDTTEKRGCFRQGCVILPNKDWETQADIAEWSIEQCRNYVLDNMEDQTELRVNHCCSEVPILIWKRPSGWVPFGEEFGFPTVEVWRRVAAYVREKMCPEPNTDIIRPEEGE